MLIYVGKKYGNIPKQLKFLNKFIAVELRFTIRKVWYCGKNYGTIEITMVLWKKTMIR